MIIIVIIYIYIYLYQNDNKSNNSNISNNIYIYLYKPIVLLAYICIYMYYIWNSYIHIYIYNYNYIYIQYIYIQYINTYVFFEGKLTSQRYGELELHSLVDTCWYYKIISSRMNQVATSASAIQPAHQESLTLGGCLYTPVQTGFVGLSPPTLDSWYCNRPKFRRRRFLSYPTRDWLQ